MANKVLFSRGFSADFNRISVKDQNTLYFLIDTHQLYLGDDRFGGIDSADVKVVGEGEFVSSVQYDSESKSIIVRMGGQIGDLESVKESIKSAVAEAVVDIKSDRDSAIKVDVNTVDGKKEVTLGLNIADVSANNNVEIWEDRDGLKAKVDIPEAGLTSVSADDNLLIDNDGVLSSAEFLLETFEQDGTQYLALKAKKPGKAAVELATLDASVLVKDSFLKSATIAEVGGKKVLRLTFATTTASGHQDEEVIDITIDDLINTTYTGGQNISVDNYQISVDNAPSGGAYDGAEIGSETISFGGTVEIPVTTYNSVGLVSGQKKLRLTMPNLSGEVGGEGKIVTQMSIVDGVLSGQSMNIDTTLTNNDGSVPTSKAVYDAVEDAKVKWTTLGN